MANFLKQSIRDVKNTFGNIFGSQGQIGGTSPEYFREKAEEWNTMSRSEKDRDIQKRKSGAVPGRSSEDNKILDDITTGILGGSFTDDDIRIISERNPLASQMISSAAQRRQANLQAFGRPLLGPGEEEFAKPDPKGAILAAGRGGRFKQISNIQSALGKGEPSLFAKINPKDYTRKSVAEFQRTRDFSKLVTQSDPSGTGDKTFNRESKLRGEYTKAAGEFAKVRDSFARIEASAVDPSAAGDLSLIFNYMKMLDPGSVVRESEFATAANSAGVPDRIRKQWNRMLRGERLAPNTRADFVDRAKRLWRRQELQHKKRKKTYTGLANRAGLNPSNVIIDIGLAEPPAIPPIAPTGTPAKGGLSATEQRELQALRRRRGR